MWEYVVDLVPLFFAKLQIPCLYLFLSQQTPIPISISRVNQFDAARLDVEMTAMLKEQLVKVFSLMKVF